MTDSTYQATAKQYLHDLMTQELVATPQADDPAMLNFKREMVLEYLINSHTETLQAIVEDKEVR